NAKTVFLGSIIGFVHMAITKFLGFWKAEPDLVIKGTHFNKASIGGELTSPLLGVGYIIGYHTSAIMMAGGVPSLLVLVPLITHFGSAIQAPCPEGSLPDTISKLSPYAIRSRYLLYIGAGAVATGGFISLARSLPTIWSAFRRGLGSIGGSAQRPVRTEQ